MVLLAAVMSKVLVLGEVMVAEPDSTVAPWGKARAIDIKDKLKHKRTVKNLEYFKKELRKFSKYIVLMKFRFCWEAFAWGFEGRIKVGGDCLCVLEHTRMHGSP